MIGNIHGVASELPPRMGGVADYAARLATHWTGGDLTEWWVAVGAEEAARANPRWTVRPVPVDASGKNWPESGTLLVHYTQYGYAGGGIPWRLVVGLRRWRRGGATEGCALDSRIAVHPIFQPSDLRASGSPAIQPSGHLPSRRLVVFFHETWLSGPPWRRRGLAAPFARWCARMLARSADVVVTNCEKQAAQLADVCEVTVLPVPTNIEPGGGRRADGGTTERRRAVDGGRSDGAQWTEDGRTDGRKIAFQSNDHLALRLSDYRSPAIRPSGLRVVIFGLPETRLRTLRAHRFFISWLVARGRLGELVLLGAGHEEERFAIAGMCLAKELAGGAVRRAGGIDAAGVSAELARADLGLSAYAADEVGKSGTLAALFTHGCPVGCSGHDARGLALDLSPGVDGAPRDWLAWQDIDARAKRESLVSAYVATSLDWHVHATRLVHALAGERAHS